MTDARPNELDRLESASDAIESLQELFASTEPLDDVLARVAQSAVSAIPDADAVSVSVLTGTGRRTAAYTDQWVLALDDEQYSTRRGPCLEAAETRRPVRVVVSVEGQRWPEFVAAARRSHIRATLSVPLLAERVDQDPELIGSLNIYSRHASAFDPFDETLMRLYTAIAGAAITNARQWQRSRETIQQLTAALTSRSDIDQAKGALRAIHGGTAEEAFQRLVKSSQDRNVKLKVVAREFLASLDK
ncbi:GAF and ANTAR domain-containing protein [Mycolicibacterium grossiae]|uniref:Response regulator receiver protein n=1 Tax=Mycolicibacterium grossiae TaxID=1552759 RepID=A0A1E8PXS6_9MYCO|nr:GAF and ANTAR domain-containing protein [Mycolicibacterium grossiae]OFJ50474.1 response regulator receiver protein [Mycolicibacterium grossiae]QEM43564.1 GAF and ANTAR domain-containing protein [Mycolicibacterium grossiae]